MIKIKLIGDHSEVHCGCKAVISAIMDAIPENSTIVSEDCESYDVLVVNGEGSMHHTTGPFQRKMKEISFAIEASKRVFLINTVWQDNDNRYDKILRNVEKIFVREVMSRDDLLRKHGLHSEVQVDLALQAKIDWDADYIDFSGRRVMTDFYSREFLSFIRITDGSLMRNRFADMKKMEWSSFVRSLQTASMLITGRHHAVMAACKARTPFVALAGNTHKIEGFLKTSGINIPICFSPNEINNVINWANSNKSAYEDLFDWVDSIPSWKINL